MNEMKNYDRWSKDFKVICVQKYVCVFFYWKQENTEFGNKNKEWALLINLFFFNLLILIIY